MCRIPFININFLFHGELHITEQVYLLKITGNVDCTSNECSTLITYIISKMCVYKNEYAKWNGIFRQLYYIKLISHMKEISVPL